MGQRTYIDLGPPTQETRALREHTQDMKHLTEKKELDDWILVTTLTLILGLILAIPELTWALLPPR